jgi:XTP/dITP diphosphohydrolase
MKDVPQHERRAQFICCLVLSQRGRVIKKVTGRVHGKIAFAKKGGRGFGYDPIFFVPKLNKTVAQMDAGEKNAISHRGNAIRKLKPFLNKLLQSIKKK